LVDSARRLPGLWIGLGAAVLAALACLCALALLAALAGLRGSLPGMPGATQSANPAIGSPASPTALIPPGKATVSPLANNSWPLSDVPMPAETDLGTMIGSPEAFSVITDQDFDEVLAFYQDEMDALGWTKVSYGTRITSNDAELQYRKDDGHVTVILARIPFVGTLVEIHRGAG
jgi:hypothetical protein